MCNQYFIQLCPYAVAFRVGEVASPREGGVDPEHPLDVFIKVGIYLKMLYWKTTIGGAVGDIQLNNLLWVGL